MGLRTGQASTGTVEAAIDRGAILRTWPMRGTIHLVPAADARWMLELLAGRRIRQMAGVYQRIGLTDAVFDRSAEVVAGALRGGRRVRRKDLYTLTERAISTVRARRAAAAAPHPRHLSMTGLTCLGPLDAQPTFVR